MLSVAPEALAEREPIAADLTTVAVPARDEGSSIGACLESILDQDWPTLQVIVVDGASRDRTAEIVRAYARRDRRVELLHNPAGTIPVSLNIAQRAARGRWFVRVDAHSAVPAGYIPGLVHHLQTEAWGGVWRRKEGGGVTPAGRTPTAALAFAVGVSKPESSHSGGTAT